MERRFITNNRARIEVRDGSGGKVITGYGAVFYNKNAPGSEFVLREGCVERIMPTAFDGTLSKNEDVRGLFNHDPSLILGRTTAGTMRLEKDSVGLRYSIDVADTQVGRDVVTSIARGDLTGSSFSFEVVDQNLRESTDRSGNPIKVREVLEVRSYDFGPVTFPAYEGTTTGIRAADDCFVEARNLFDEWNARKDTAMESRGRALAAELNRIIDGKVNDTTTRVEIIAMMARGAGIEPATVNEILNASIVCPPLNRLSGFARVLGVSLSSLRTAAERDGCDYSSGSNSGRCVFCIGKEKSLRMAEIKLQEALRNNA